MKKKTSHPAKSNSSAGKSKPPRAPRTPGRIYRRLKAAVSEMQAIRRSEAAPARTWEVVPDRKGGFVRRQLGPLHVNPAPVHSGNAALAARKRLGLSQPTFAALLGVSPGTLQGWEQGRRDPNRAARVLLRVATTHPEAVLAAAKSESRA